ncbi:DUF1540 domain-containing protein [Nesterenkonia sp. F]|uniref:DUF1540 domain-containing protein n=1 Tax=Nesterenkonia sp. F TaxID=795955 RepID=UPI000255D783|nr:DUF1540 domain-containing protein [Nesterenkonia sp. F]
MNAPASVASCQVTECAFNADGCHADAVTIAGSEGAPTCGTFIELDVRGGLPTAQGHVGACQRLECMHNKDLMCTAEAVTIGGDTTNCLTYEQE